MLWQLVIVVLLVSFNMFVADALVRMRRDIREIHGIIVPSSPFVNEPEPAPEPEPKKSEEKEKEAAAPAAANKKNVK
jgi:hypothetical protein